VALVEVDELGAETLQRLVDLMQHLLARDPAAAVGGLRTQLRREDVRVARPCCERTAEHFLGATLRVDVRSVEEVDPDVECRIDESDRNFVVEAAAERRPRTEADLRDEKIAVAELAISQAGDSSVSIWARCSRPE
jgi:hypothetical protein